MNSLPHPVLAALPGGWEIILILAIILLLFGGKKLPELAKGVGKSIREFKKASSEDGHEDAADAKPAPKPAEAPKTGPTHGAN